MAHNYVCVSCRGEILESREASPNQPSHGRQKVGSAKAGSLVHLERNTMGRPEGMEETWAGKTQRRLRQAEQREAGRAQKLKKETVGEGEVMGGAWS